MGVDEIGWIKVCGRSWGVVREDGQLNWVAEAKGTELKSVAKKADEIPPGLNNEVVEKWKAEISIFILVPGLFSG